MNYFRNIKDYLRMGNTLESHREYVTNLPYDDWLDRTQNIPNLLIKKENFLDSNDIDFLINYYYNNQSHLEDNGSIYLMDDFFEKYTNKLIQIANDNGLYDVEKDTMMISNTENNGGVVIHHDNCKVDNNGNIFKNHTPHRTFTATVSLTDDFTGGNLFISKSRNHNNFQEIDEKLGEVICFTANSDHKHYVSPLKNGRRLRLLIWLQYKPNLFHFRRIINLLIFIFVFIIIIYIVFIKYLQIFSYRK